MKKIKVGSRVKVPFGHQELEGFVLELTHEKEDYELKGKIETGLDYSGSVSHSNSGLTYVLIIYNNSEENKEISEIGFYKKVRMTSDPATYKTFLLGRATLDTPEVIAPQTSKTYQITLEL